MTAPPIWNGASVHVNPAATTGGATHASSSIGFVSRRWSGRARAAHVASTRVAKPAKWKCTPVSSTIGSRMPAITHPARVATAKNAPTTRNAHAASLVRSTNGHDGAVRMRSASRTRTVAATASHGTANAVPPRPTAEFTNASANESAAA
jgi:hypothetical protein